MRAYGITNAAPYASPPPVGLAGDTYFSTSAKQLYVSDGTQWLPLLQGDFFFGTFSTPTTTLGNDVYNTIGWTQTKGSGFTLANSNQRITVARAGRYQITTEISFASSGAVAAYSRAQIIQYNSGGTQITSIANVGGSAAANAYALATLDGIFDASVGDYFIIQGAIQNASAVINQAWVSVVPVGGVAGPQGPDIAAAQSSYAHLKCSSTSITTGTTNLTWSTPSAPLSFINGFTQPQTHQVSPSQTGRYLVMPVVSINNGGVNTFLTITVGHYNSVGSNIVNHTLTGGAGNASGQWTEVSGAIMLNCTAGDLIVIQAIAGVAGATDTRSHLTIVPIGGVKGDQGIQGPSGGIFRVASAVNNGAAQSGIGSAVTDLTGLTLSNLALISGHRYKVSWNVVVLQNTAGGTCNIPLRDGSNTILNNPGATLVANAYDTIQGMYEFVAFTTSLTLKLGGQTSAGTLTIQNGSNNASIIDIYDVGT